ncbi:hypothetical protein AWE51_00305 [Aquimarina aggregata]|uniref:AAA+ ATPase domain-containing protein n=1 Tax=Aquimarina aggregata TaxID=1642818 RepID=A0A163BZN0_9FLAO|nr:AAA family ATPase [Aquimarina aggregata]KZS41923.1 hypothetical protein AWE51_00305 [Aquimarina aggregata]
MENFINEIDVLSARNVNDLKIPLSSHKRQHLIITGKNGSGKTSLLLEVRKFLHRLDALGQNPSNSQKIIHFKESFDKKAFFESNNVSKGNDIFLFESYVREFGGTMIDFSNTYEKIQEKIFKGEFVLAYFSAKRDVKMDVPNGIKKLDLKKRYQLHEKVNNDFIQFIVNLTADRSFARDDNEKDVVLKIDEWFVRFENRLKTLFNDENLKLKFDRKKYNYTIEGGQGEPFNFNTLSDGYSAIISIVSELLLRMEGYGSKAYDLEGVVIIDEIETHLHVELQKAVLPFLIDFFPRIQFIVTTHSPFVLSSISNATICDLEFRLVTNDLTSYSYDALIESYFGIDKYSNEVKSKVSQYEILLDKSELNENELENLRELRHYFDHSPKFLSPELLVKLQEIKLKEIVKKKKK